MNSLASAVLGGALALAVVSGPASAAEPKAAPAASASRALADRLAIEDLMGRYEWALDAGDAQAYAALFTPDAVLSSSVGDQTGRPAIVKMIQGLAQRRTARIQHILSNLVIDLHGDEADAKSYWTEVWNPKGPGLEVRAAGHYEDKLVRRHGKWWFARRKIAEDIMPAVRPA